MIISFLLLVLGFVLVVKGADVLIDGSSSLAKQLQIPEIVIGLTVVAFGTSAPELVVNVYSSLAGKSQMVLGNVIGSNICNTFLILGIASLIYPLTVQRNSVRKEIPFSLLAAAVFFFLVNDTTLWNSQVNRITRLDGLLLFALFCFFIYYTFILSKTASAGFDDITAFSPRKSWLLILLGMAGLFAGGKLVVDNAVQIARQLGVSEKLIAVTIVSLGTSLPELAASAVAALKKRSDLAVGNVVGSNIFNILLVMGVSSGFSPIRYDTIFNIDLAVFVFGTLLMLVFIFVGKKHKISRPQAVSLLLMYAAYVIYAVGRQ
ncbi:MAG: calcium/sodium antiporter [bacterium]|nr:calcium/sodium antiporter [bacterium]